jgi:triphosphatase
MVTEIELKLRISPGQLARLKRSALLKEHQVTRPSTRRLYNIYFDTPELELHKSGMALRLRRSGRQWLQTLKGGGSVRAGLHQRNEWEVPVTGAALDFSLLTEVGEPQATEWEEHLPKSLRNILKPVFVTDFSRSSRMLSWQGALIELCMDLGVVRTEKSGIPICELELELKSGQPQQLFEMALAILDIVPFELEVISKAEQGYRLISEFVVHPVKAATASFTESDTLAEALRSLIWSSLMHFQSNLSGAKSGDDAEYLHQARVALRRLRVVLRMTEKFRSDQQLAALSTEIAALCVALGRIREWDVFIAQTLQPMCTRMKGNADSQTLLKVSKRQRDVCHAALFCESQLREIQRLILRFTIWMHGPYWQNQRDMPQIGEFATSRLKKLAKRFDRSSQNLDMLNVPRLHELRIIAKKLRYSAEFFSGLYDGKKARPFLASLSKVQDVLGQINDIAVNHRLLDDLTMHPGLVGHQKAIVLARSRITADLHLKLAALRIAIQRFIDQTPFWGE